MLLFYFLVNNVTMKRKLAVLAIVALVVAVLAFIKEIILRRNVYAVFDNSNNYFELDCDMFSLPDNVMSYNDYIQYLNHNVRNVEKRIQYDDKIWVSRFLTHIDIPGPQIITMGYGRNSLKELKRALISESSYCCKPSHFCSSYMCFIVHNSSLLQDVKVPKGIVYKGPQSKGDLVSPGDIDEAMQLCIDHHDLNGEYRVLCEVPGMFLYNGSPRGGFVLENLWPEASELKVLVAAGNITVITQGDVCLKSNTYVM